MKYKLITFILMMFSLIVTSCSCSAMAQVAVETPMYGTYEYIYNSNPVVYYDGVPYSVYYSNNAWVKYVIPFEYRHLIVHLSTPRRYYFHPQHHHHHQSHPMPVYRHHIPSTRGHGVRPQMHGTRPKTHHNGRNFHEKRK